MYKIGDKIVYPMHGAGIIEAIEEREIFEEIAHLRVVAIAIDHLVFEMGLIMAQFLFDVLHLGIEFIVLPAFCLV